MTFAFIFLGQGLQSAGMFNAFADHPATAATLVEASDVLGQDIGKLVVGGPAEELNLTINMQPVTLTAAVVIYCAWQTAGDPTPIVVAGHSLSEYSVLVAADAITFEDAVPLVCFHTKVMQGAVPVGKGGMAAILGLSDDDVRTTCAEASVAGTVEVMNSNALAQVVTADTKAAAEKACEIAKVKGVKRVLPSPVLAPFHSSLFKPTLDHLREYLVNVTVNAPVIPVVDDVDVAVVSDPAAAKDTLVRRAILPIRWIETVQKMRGDGITCVVECGPGKVLAGLVKRIDDEIVGDAIFDLASLEVMSGQLK